MLSEAIKKKLTMLIMILLLCFAINSFLCLRLFSLSS
ncbi:hypothetical protein cco111_05312 [Campylobacter coli 2680]|nr:hypothetical protein cco111_05312 [Campylobacter coli 2680]